MSFWEDEIRPAVLGKPQFRVSPEDRFAHANKAHRKHEKLPLEQEVLVPRNMDEEWSWEEKATIDVRPLIYISELEYPGKRTNIETDVRAGKWVYGFNRATRKCVVEGQRQDSDGSKRIWRSRRESAISPKSCEATFAPADWNLHGVWVDTDESTGPADLVFFLSPHRLSADGLSLLLGELDLDPESPQFPFVRVHWMSAAAAYVALPDPFAWCVAVATKYYQPLIATHQDYINDPERNAELVIAKVLKMWIDGDLDQVKNELFVQPGEYIKWDQKRSDYLKDDAEFAAAYLVGCAHSIEFRAVELSSMYLGGAALQNSLLAWGFVLDSLSLTEVGSAFVNTVAKAHGWTPDMYVFSKVQRNNEPDWANNALANLGARMVMTALGPAVARNAFNKAAGGKSRENRKSGSDAATEELLNALRRVTGDVSFYERVKEHSRMRVRRSTDSIVTLDVDYERLKISRGTKDILEGQSLEEIVAPHQAAAILFTYDSLDKTPISHKGVIKVFNLAMGLIAFASAPEPDDSLGVGPVDWAAKHGAWLGGTADVLSLTADFYKDKAEKLGSAAGKKVAGAAAGVLGVVSGVVTVCVNMKEVKGSLGKGNYGQAAAFSLGIYAGAVSVLAGVMAIVGALSGAASLLALAGPIGILAGVIGLVAGLIAALLTKDPFEDFARFSFLGNDGGPGLAARMEKLSGQAMVLLGSGEPEYKFDLVRAVYVPLGTSVRQLQLLLFMMAAFVVRWWSTLPTPMDGMPYVPKSKPPSKIPGPGPGNLFWRSVRDGRPSTQWDSMVKVPTEWAQIDFGHFPPGSSVTVAIVYELSKPAWRVGGTALGIQLRFSHSSPGQLRQVPVKQDTHGQRGVSNVMTFEMFDAEYLVETEAIRSMRICLCPRLAKHVDSRESMDTEAVVDQVRFAYTPVQVFARIHLEGQSGDLSTMPDDIRWIKLNLNWLAGGGEVSSFDKDQWTDSGVFLHPS